MRFRSRWWVLSVLSFLGTGTGAYAQHDPNAFTSLGTLNVSSGTLTINTDTLAMSGAAAFTGVALSQSGGPQIAVFDFSNITIGSSVTVNITGSRGLALLSRGTTTVASALTPSGGGYVGGFAPSANIADPGAGPGGGGAYAGNVGGGGFGGKGGGGSVSPNLPLGGNTYGNLFNVLEGGSGGGASSTAGASRGGNGGAAIELSSIGAMTVSNNITANGTAGDAIGGSTGGAGGAGGGILLYSAAGLTFTGNLTATGGSGGSTGNTYGGGGGRIGIGGISTYTHGTPLGLALNGNATVSGGSGVFGTGYAGTVTIDALSTTVPSGTSITLNGNPITSIAGSTTQTGATVEAYVRKDLVVNSGATVTLGMDNALKRLDATGINITSLQVDGTFNTAGYNQFVQTLFGAGTINLNSTSVLQVGEANPLIGGGSVSLFTGTLAGDGIVRLRGSNVNPNELDITGSTSLGGGFDLGATTTLALRPPAATTQTISSPISGAGNIQVANGTGIALLSGNNTYTGTTKIFNGTLKAGSNTAFGFNSAVTVSSGTTLDIGGFTVAIGSLTGSGAVIGSSGTLTTGGDNTFTTFSGSLAISRLIKVGTGTFVLSGTGAPTAELGVDGGILSAGISMSPTTIRIGPDGTLNLPTASVTLGGNIVGASSSSAITINANNTSLGNASSFTGFNHQGTLSLGANTVTLNSLGYAQLGSLTTLSGGTINATNGVALGSGSNLSGNGTVSAKVSAQLGSVINATGSLSLGSSTTPAGFITAGELRTNANTVTLNSSSRATLGSLTTLGSGGSPGTVTATNGVLVDFGNSLVGYGTINTPNNLIQRSIINGTVQGTSGAQPITFTGWVKGVGTFNNVVFAGTWDPGFSPTLITAGSIGFSATNNLIMELGGMTRGSQFDGIDATGNVNLAGALSITRINGFSPNTGDAFVLINRTGGTGTFTGLNEGTVFTAADGGTYIISYQGINYMTNQLAPGANAFSVVIAAIPEPTTWALIGLGTAAAGWMGYRRYKRFTRNWEAEIASPQEELI